MSKDKKLKNIYSKIAKSYAEESNVSEHIDEFLSLLTKGETILDAGCGSGIDANYMSCKGFHVIGVDFSKEMIKIAKSTYPTIEFRLGDFNNLDFANSTFDGITLLYSVIHLPKKDIKSILEKFYKILKKKGIIYLALQSGKSEETYIDALYHPDEKMFLNVFSYEEIKEILQNIGFSIEKKYEREPKDGELNYRKLHIIARK